MKVTVDDDVCGGHGVCASLCPAVFEIDDDYGFATVVVDLVPEQAEESVREAALRCPSHAIEVTET